MTIKVNLFKMKYIVKKSQFEKNYKEFKTFISLNKNNYLSQNFLEEIQLNKDKNDEKTIFKIVIFFKLNF